MRAPVRSALAVFAVAAALAGGAVAAAPAAKPAGPAITDMALGDPHAKVVVIEYGSVSCPHCAAWSKEVFPAFKTKFIDTGKVRYVFRETPIHGAIDVAGFRLARCAGPAQYFSTIDALFAGQETLFQSKDGMAWLLGAGAKVGMDEAKVKACLDDEAAAKALAQHEDSEAEAMHVKGTPTIFVNGKSAGDGEVTLDQLSAKIAAAETPARKHGRR